LRGRPSAVVFVQAGCSSCAAELQMLSALASRTPGMRFVAVEASGATAADLAAFARRIGATGPVALAADSSGDSLAHYSIRSLDTVLVLDRSGAVKSRLTLPKYEQLRAAVRKVVA
jgi:thiol-disulfide isomerase/thioredoxin